MRAAAWACATAVSGCSSDSNDDGADGGAGFDPGRTTDGGRGFDAGQVHDGESRANDAEAGAATPDTDASMAGQESEAAAGSPEVGAPDAEARTPTAMAPVKLAPFIGPRSTPAAGQANIGFHGADLGWSFQHGTDLRFLFGDSWADAYATPIGQVGDDAEATISLLDFPNGDAVEHRLVSGQPWWQNAAPPATFVTTSQGKAANILLYRGGLHVGVDAGADAAAPAALPMGLGRVPAAGFGNAGPAHPENAAFGIFSRIEVVECSATDHTCADGFVCDQQMGVCAGSTALPSLPCVIDSNDCPLGNACNTVSGGGLCEDRGSSVYRSDDDFGRMEAVVVRHEIGNADPLKPEVFYTQPWETNRFLNPSVRTVEDFDPNRTDASQNDYRPADGSRPASEKVFLWGRPNFVGVAKAHVDARLYFATVDMPVYSDTGNFAWKPQYFTGTSAGKPTFSPNPTEAVPLDLSGGANDPTEQWDYVEQMSVSYVAPLHQWMMLYGGAAPFGPAAPSPGSPPNYSSTGEAVGDPQGAIHIRFATNPWGPWSVPQQLLIAGDPKASPPTLEYADNGMLHDDSCVGSHCAPDEKALAYAITPWGWLYGPSIVDPWTTERTGGAADVYWTVSTWAPYGTVLMKTTITP